MTAVNVDTCPLLPLAGDCPLCTALGPLPPQRLQEFSNCKVDQNRPSKIDGRHLGTGAKARDRFALTVLDQVTLPMAQALGVLVGSVGVEKIIFVGGFALGVGKPLLEGAPKQFGPSWYVSEGIRATS